MRVQELMRTWLASHEEVLHALPRPPTSSRALDTQPSHSLQIWDAELRKMRDAVARTIEHRNELVPISALPAELLARVFNHLADIWPVNSCTCGCIDCTRGWSRIVLVCRRWHAVAVQCASLWATVSLDGYEPMDLFLERAQAFPLSVIGSFSPCYSRQLRRLERVLEHCGRFASLDINVTGPLGLNSDDEDSVVFQGLSTMSTIEHMSIRYSKFSSHSVDFRDCGPSRDFVSSLATRLTVIRLDGYVFPWGAGSSSLRSLTWTWSGSAEPRNYDIADVLDSLRAMPALERLDLQGCLPDSAQPSQAFVGTQNLVSLPHMKDIKLTSDNEACWTLWALLDIHPSAAINISSTCSSTPKLIAEVLSRHVQRPCGPKYTSLNLCQRGFFREPRLTVAHSDADEMSSICSDLRIRLILTIDSWTDDELPFLILSVVPLENLEMLNIGGWCHEWSREDLTLLFASAHHLRRIELRGTSAARALLSLLLPEGLLSMPTAEHQAVTATDLALPSLSELHMHSVDLRSTLCDDRVSSRLAVGEGSSIALPGGESSAALPLGEELSAALRIRQVTRNPISLLSISDCKLAVDWIPTWTGSVTNLEWDNVSGDYYYRGSEEGRMEQWDSPQLDADYEAWPVDPSGDTQSSLALGWGFGDPNEEALAMSDEENVWGA